jgi:hypothetical protein
MTDFYCDISAIGNEYQGYADTPTTWGVPQDGNGKAGPGHAAAVAIGTIDCASASASGAGVLAVLGVTVSSTLTGSDATLATNITTAINATATATGATYSALLLPLNKLVFARVNPGTNTQVQIMLRIAGADWNGMTHTTAGTWGTTPTMGAFSGGVDGPFSYMITTATVFGKTARTYGLVVVAAAAVANPGVLDVVHCRTRRSGTDLSLVLATASDNFNWVSRNYLFDDGTVWSGDNGKLTWYYTGNYSGTGSFGGANSSVGTKVSLVSRSKYNFEIQLGATGNVGMTCTFFACYQGSTTFLMKNCRFVEYATNIGSIALANHQGAGTIEFVDSQAVFKTRTFSVVTIVSGVARMNGSSVLVNAASGALGVVAVISAATTAANFEWVGGEIRDLNGVYTCSSPATVNAANVASSVVIDGVIGITQPSVGFTATVYGIGKFWWSQTEGASRGFRQENAAYALDWRGDGTFPHCGAQNLQGNYWSHRLSWGAGSAYDTSVTPIKIAHFYRAASAVKTITIELLVPDTTTIYTDEIEMAVSYMDGTDVWRTEALPYGVRTLSLTAGRTAIPSSSKVWTLNGVAGYSPKKLELTTAYPVKTNTEIGVRVSLCAYRASAIALYVSPELA